MNDPEPGSLYVPYLTDNFWEETALDRFRYDTFVETGSYRGFVLEFMKTRFRFIDSIELSNRWYEFCREKFRNDAHMYLHQFEYNWTGITLERVLGLMKPGYGCLENAQSRYTVTPREDQLIFYPLGDRAFFERRGAGCNGWGGF